MNTNFWGIGNNFVFYQLNFLYYFLSWNPEILCEFEQNKYNIIAPDLNRHKIDENTSFYVQDILSRSLGWGCVKSDTATDN